LKVSTDSTTSSFRVEGSINNGVQVVPEVNVLFTNVEFFRTATNNQRKLPCLAKLDVLYSHALLEWKNQKKDWNSCKRYYKQASTQFGNTTITSFKNNAVLPCHRRNSLRFVQTFEHLLTLPPGNLLIILACDLRISE
jgi:hypothetical protein